jgi:hypothetical protein
LAIELGFSFISFLLFKRENLDHLGLSLSGHNFQLESLKDLFPQPFLVGEK